MNQILIILISLFILPLNTQAQRKPSSYIVTHTGDTIRGSIKKPTGGNYVYRVSVGRNKEKRIHPDIVKVLYLNRTTLIRKRVVNERVFLLFNEKKRIAYNNFYLYKREFINTNYTSGGLGTPGSITSNRTKSIAYYLEMLDSDDDVIYLTHKNKDRAKLIGVSEELLKRIKKKEFSRNTEGMKLFLKAYDECLNTPGSE